MDNISRASYIVGSILATVPATTELEGWVSAVGSLGGFGVLVYAVSYTIKLLKRKTTSSTPATAKSGNSPCSSSATAKTATSPKRPTKPSLTTKTNPNCKVFLTSSNQFYRK